jgi:transposase InsO family protein
VAVRWYLRFNLSYRDVEQLLLERGVVVDHVSAYRWVQRFTPLLADAARFARHSPGRRWFADETYVRVNGVWRYVYRAIDEYGQVIDVLVSARRDAESARRFFQRALATFESRAEPGGHRRRPDLPRRASGVAAHGVASRRAVREQPDRGRPRPARRCCIEATLVVVAVDFPADPRCSPMSCVAGAPSRYANEQFVWAAGRHPAATS